MDKYYNLVFNIGNGQNDMQFELDEKKQMQEMVALLTTEEGFLQMYVEMIERPSGTMVDA